MFGFKSKKDKQIEEMQDQLNQLTKSLLDKQAEEEEQEEPESFEDAVAIDDSETPQGYIVAKWSPEHETFKLDVNWNPGFLKNAIALGVDGETDLEVAAFGFMVFAQQIIEQDREKRANRKNTVQE
jgi:hypothetical protein